MGPGHGMLIETQQTQSRLTANSLQQTTHEGGECEIGLDKNFGFLDQFAAQYEMGKEIGRGGFGRTCSAKAKGGSLKGQEVAVKVIRKSKVSFSFVFPLRILLRHLPFLERILYGFWFLFSR